MMAGIFTIPYFCCSIFSCFQFLKVQILYQVQKYRSSLADSRKYCCSLVLLYRVLHSVISTRIDLLFIDLILNFLNSQCTIPAYKKLATTNMLQLVWINGFTFLSAHICPLIFPVSPMKSLSSASWNLKAKIR